MLHPLHKYQPLNAVYDNNHMEHVNTQRGQNMEFFIVKPCGVYSYHCLDIHESMPYDTTMKITNKMHYID